MCGIIGYISTREHDNNKLLNFLSHRGPDGRGFYKEYLFNKFVFLGHTRLKIIDLSIAGNQPMYSDDRKIILIYNGEIYNYQELKEEYLSDVKFNSKTDTEVILKLYEKFGIDSITKLNGDFAIAILDKNINKLFLIRDRIGVKPLYYFIDNGNLVFCSEIKPMLDCGIIPSLNKNYLELFFVFKYVPGEETLFKGIKRLKPASILEYDLLNNNYNIYEFWTLSEKKDYKKLSYVDAKDYLFNLLNKCVISQIVSDVPVGIFFSGGVDSSILAYILREYKDIKYYVARKNLEDIKKEGTTSDFYFASKFANEFSLKVIPIDIGGLDMNLENINLINYYSDDLIADGSQIPSFFITKEAKKTSTVLLSGMGGDELFYGYAGHQLTLLSSYFDKFPEHISNYILNLFKSLNPGKGYFKSYKRYLKKFGLYALNKQVRIPVFNIVGDYYNSISILKYSDGSSLKFFANYFGNIVSLGASLEDIFRAISRFEFDNFLVKNLHYLDRMCMANSTEGRVPYLDYRLVEFAWSLPLNYKLSPFGQTKRILKDAYRRYLPSYILSRRKAGFGMPLRSIFSSEKKIDKLLDVEFVNDIGFFSQKNVKRIIENHINGFEDNSPIIYALISFQEWYKMFIKS